MSNSLPIDKDFCKKFESDQTIQNFIKIYGNKNRNNINHVRVKSDQTLSAQNTELCESWSKAKPLISVNKLLTCASSGLSVFDRAVLELQFLYGARISEVLSIKPSDISPNGHIKLTGSKGSDNRIVYAIMFKDFWEGMRINGWCIPTSYNRFYFYRLYKKKGLYLIFGNNVKNSVTHSLRYGYLISLLEQNLELDEIRHILGHKSIQSTIHYVENIRINARS